MQPRGRKKRLKGDDRQQEIVDAVVALLEEGADFSAISIEDIASRGGISRSNFYFYFESKQAALMAALARVQQDMFAVARAFFDAPGEPTLEEMNATLRGIVRVWREHRFVMRAFADAGGSDPAVWKALEAFIESFVPETAGRIVRICAGKNRIVSADYARELARCLIWANERNLYRAVMSDASEQAWNSVADTMTDIWRAAIIGPAA